MNGFGLKVAWRRCSRFRAHETSSQLDRSRLLTYSAVLLIAEILIFLFMVAGTHGWIVPLERPTTTDFVSFYAAGSLADAGTPALAYDQAAHYAAEQQVTAPGIEHQVFYYPPTFLLICALVGRLPYLIAYIVFELATLIPCLAVARATVKASGWTSMVPLLAFPAVFWTLGLGQNAFLTAALFGGGLLLIDRRPGLAGVLFGALCYKPHLGLLIPVALAAGSRWRAMLAAALTVVTIVLLSIALFGWQTWQSFFALATAAPDTYGGQIDPSGYVTLFGGLRLMGAPLDLAYAVQGLGTIAAIALVVVFWRGDFSLPLRAAVLLLATLIAVPVALFYDFLLAGIAIAWLVRLGNDSGFRPWEKTALSATFAVALLSRNLAQAFHLPFAPLMLLALLTLIGARAFGERAARMTSVMRHSALSESG